MLKNKGNFLLIILVITNFLMTACSLNKRAFACPNSVLKSFKSERRSLGNKILFRQDNIDNQNNKQLGVKAFNNCDFYLASKELKYALENQPNDPESWIYLNNSEALNKEKNTLKIAVVVPTHRQPELAQEILQGVSLAQKKVNNEGGIDGKRLIVEIVNDDNEPEIARQLAEELVKDENILAIVGHSSSNTSLVTLPIYHRGKLVMVTPNSTSANFSVLSKYAFTTTLNVSILAKILSNYINNNISSKLIICHDSQDNYSLSLKTQLNKIMKDKIMTIYCDLNPNNSNFNPANILKIALENNVQGIILLPSQNNLNLAFNLIKSNATLTKPLQLFATDNMHQSETLKKGQNTVEKMILAVSWYDVSNSTFQSQNNNVFGNDKIDWHTAMAYDATKVIIEGLKEDNTRKGLQKVLSEETFFSYGAREIIKFNQVGDRLSQPKLLQIKNNKFQLK